MCENVIGECRCDCHESEWVQHVGPCCYPCAVCGVNVSVGYESAHNMHCKPLPVPEPELQS